MLDGMAGKCRARRVPLDVGAVIGVAYRDAPWLCAGHHGTSLGTGGASMGAALRIRRMRCFYRALTRQRGRREEGQEWSSCRSLPPLATGAQPTRKCISSRDLVAASHPARAGRGGERPATGTARLSPCPPIALPNRPAALGVVATLLHRDEPQHGGRSPACGASAGCLTDEQCRGGGRQAGEGRPPARSEGRWRHGRGTVHTGEAAEGAARGALLPEDVPRARTPAPPTASTALPSHRIVMDGGCLRLCTW